MLRTWESVPTRIKRILIIILFFIILLLITVAGTLKPLSIEEATKISQKLREEQKYVLEADLFRGTTMIFGNNFFLCLLFFAPIFGPIFGFNVLYNTGVVIAAQSISIGAHPVAVLLFLFNFPFTWLEFIAYSIAFTQSVWLTYRTIRSAWKKELTNTCVMVTICAVILLTAAIIEMATIQALPKTS